MTVTAEYAATGLPPVLAPTGIAYESASQFLLELAHALQVHGTPANRLETSLQSVATRLGLEAQFFSTPTSLLVGIGPPVEQRVHLLRVEPGGPNLGHLSQLSAITRDVVEGTANPAEGSRRIASLLSSPPRWPLALRLFAFVLSSSAIACFLRVNRIDVGIAALLGLVTGLTVLFTARRDSLSHVTEILTAFIVSTIAFTIDAVTVTQSGYATSLAGLAVLLPGLMLTTALTELSAQHLSSGTARLMGAMVVFLALAFGIALGARFGSVVGHLLGAIFPAIHVDSSVATFVVPGSSNLPAWTEWLALLIAPLSFTVLLNAERRDAGIIVVAAALAYITARTAGRAVGEELGAFLGALVVSAGSNLNARWLKRSAMVTLTPGLLVLVPGSIGFRSVTSMLGQDVQLGVTTAFRVALIGISLAGGVLAGNVVTESFRGRRRRS